MTKVLVSVSPGDGLLRVMTSSNGNFFRVTGPLCGELVNSTHKGQWRGALLFSLICTCMNGWVNNREAGDLRCHRASYTATVMNQGRHNVNWTSKQISVKFESVCKNSSKNVRFKMPSVEWQLFCADLNIMTSRADINNPEFQFWQCNTIVMRIFDGYFAFWKRTGSYPCGPLSTKWNIPRRHLLKCDFDKIAV